MSDTRPVLTERELEVLTAIAEHPGKRPAGATPEDLDTLWRYTLVDYNPLRASIVGKRLVEMSRV